MDLDAILAELESDLNWRLEEMRFYGNILHNLASDEEKRVFRKSMIVMLYAHYEGFCKVAFSTYASEINKAKLTCGDVNDFIGAASLADLFGALFDTNRKCDLFRNTLPNDPVVHRLAREVELVAGVDQLSKRLVEIPIDAVVDTESNLKPAVLRKILYRLGFPYDAFAKHEGKIHRLLNIRHSVAHGVFVSGVEDNEYQEVEKVTYEVVNEVKALVWNALKDNKYQRQTKTA